MQEVIELPIDSLSEEHQKNLAWLEWMNAPDVISMLATIDYVALPAIPECMYEMVMGMEEGVINARFTEGQWVREAALELIRWWRMSDRDRWRWAIERDRMDLVRYGAERCGILMDSKVLCMAIRKGTMRMIQYLLERESPMTGKVFATAGASGRIEVMEILWRKKCPIGTGTLSSAIYNGREEAVRWLLEKGAPSQSCIHNCGWAAGGGHPELLAFFLDHLSDEYIPENIREWCGFICIEHGRLNTLQWLHKERGQPLRSAFCTCAARHDQLPILQWLRSQGCPWTRSACLGHAQRNKNPLMIAWIQKIKINK